MERDCVLSHEGNEALTQATMWLHLKNVMPKEATLHGHVFYDPIHRKHPEQPALETESRFMVARD